MERAGHDPSALPRRIGWFTAACVLVSNVVGTGIFTTTGFMARDLGHPGLIPYRTPFYPFVPVFFILMSMVIIWSAVSERPLEAGLGIATVLAGTPLYLLWRRLSSGCHT